MSRRPPIDAHQRCVHYCLPLANTGQHWPTLANTGHWAATCSEDEDCDAIDVGS